MIRYFALIVMLFSLTAVLPADADPYFSGKIVQIPYVAENGTIHPNGSLIVWPVRCKPK